MCIESEEVRLDLERGSECEANRGERNAFAMSNVHES
jgi:hypothetical protein